MTKDKFEKRLQSFIDEARAIKADNGILTLGHIADNLGIAPSTLYQPKYKDILFQMFPELGHKKAMRPTTEQLEQKLSECKALCQRYRATITSVSEKARAAQKKADEYEEKYRRLLGEYQRLASSKRQPF